MRIAIIAHPLHAGGGASVGKNLMRSLLAVAPHHEYFVSYPVNRGYEEVVVSSKIDSTAPYNGGSKLSRRIIYELNVLRPKLRVFNPHLMICLANAGVNGIDCPQAILCHNPYLFYPKKYFGKRTLFSALKMSIFIMMQKILLSKAIKQEQNFFLYQTKTALKRVDETYNLRAKPIHCPNSFSFSLAAKAPKDYKHAAVENTKSNFKLFYLTRFYPHKNLEILIDVFSKYKADLSNVVTFITIDEEQHPNASRLLKAIEDKGLECSIVNVGPLRQEELIYWYNASDALIMPTLLESFSGAYLEAMNYRVPILTSNLDFAHEICGPAALYFDPWKPETIRDAILKLKSDAKLSRELISGGEKQINYFKTNWDGIASHLLQKLEEGIQR